MASNWKEVMAKLERDDEYPRQFREIWPDGLSPAHIQSAIAEFERSLVTLDSPFDQYLRGQDRALPEAARRGWRTHPFESWQGWARRLVAEGLLTEKAAGLA